MSLLRVVPLQASHWPHLEQVFGPRGSSCWCQRFRRPEQGDPAVLCDERSRRSLRREVEDAEAPVGLLALHGAEGVGWSRVVPRATLPGVTENRALARILDEDADAWWISCFVVRRDHRRSGVATALLEAAVTWASDHGASVLDGHPVDASGLTGAPSPSALFTGTLDTFRRVGFEEIGRTYRTRPVMRRTFTGR